MPAAQVILPQYLTHQFYLIPRLYTRMGHKQIRPQCQGGGGVEDNKALSCRRFFALPESRFVSQTFIKQCAENVKPALIMEYGQTESRERMQRWCAREQRSRGVSDKRSHSAAQRHAVSGVTETHIQQDRGRKSYCYFRDWDLSFDTMSGQGNSSS